MRSLRLALFSCLCPILFILSMVFAGCSGSSPMVVNPSPSPTPPFNPTPSPVPSPSASPTPTPSPSPAAASRFIYGIVDFEADGGFFGGAINGTTGQVTALSGNPFSNTLGQNIVIQVIADPQGRFLYSLNLGASSFGIQFGKPGINEYQVNQSNGNLQPVPNGDVIFTAGVHNVQMAIDGKGKFLYEPHDNLIDIYSIDQSSGLLTLIGSSSAAAPAGTFTAASPDGRFLFNSGGGNVEVFSIDQTNGQLSLAATSASAGSAGPLAVSVDSSMLFAANTAQGTLSVFRIGTNGMLAQMMGSPFSIDTQAESIVPAPNNKFVYLAFGQPAQSDVKGYAFDATAGSLTPISGASVANGMSINVDRSGKFAFVTVPQQLNTYAIDPTTGTLTQLSQAPQPLTDDPTNMVVTP